MGNYSGNFVVSKIVVIANNITGVTHVKKGGKLITSGNLNGGLIVDQGGIAVVSGDVGRNVVNNGNLVLNGDVAGRILGEGTVVMGPGVHVSDNDVPVETVLEDSAA